MKRNKAEAISLTYDGLKPGAKPPGLSSAKIKTIFKLLLKTEKINKTVGIVFTNNRTIRQLNRTYRYTDSVTDVLSFEYGKGSEMLGEIIISLETAEKQAGKYGNSFTVETVLLLIHGFYHILGHRHYWKADFHKMNKKEQQAFKILQNKRLV